MKPESLRDSAHFEEAIKYIFVEFLLGFENAMGMVTEELRGFGEKGMSSCHDSGPIAHHMR